MPSSPTASTRAAPAASTSTATAGALHRPSPAEFSLTHPHNTITASNFMAPVRRTTSDIGIGRNQGSSIGSDFPDSKEEPQAPKPNEITPCDAHGGGKMASSPSKSAIDISTPCGPTVGGFATPSSKSSGGYGGSGGGDDDMTDTDESVTARLAEFTEMARRTVVHNEELSRQLSDQKRRADHNSRKLDQFRSTCNELRQSLTLAQDTVIKLREHELRWAESTASEMSLRSELCALKDEHAAAVSETAILKRRCDALHRENNELGERFASIAEEKRKVEARARRLLRSDRYRGF